MHAYDENTFARGLNLLRKTQSGLEKQAEKEGLTKKQHERLAEQLTRLRDFGGRLETAANKKIRIDPDDGVLTNYTKVQGGEALFPPIK